MVIPGDETIEIRCNQYLGQIVCTISIPGGLMRLIRRITKTTGLSYGTPVVFTQATVAERARIV